MSEIVRMPKLSDTMTEGVLVKWHKKVGDTVKTGELLAEIETDKATMEFESFFEGSLLHIGIKEGQAAVVDAIIAIIGNKGENIEEILNKEKNGAKVEVKSKAETGGQAISTQEIKQKSIPQTISPSHSTPGIQNTTFIPSVKALKDGRLKASPLAKKLANEKNINLSLIRGTGDDGRIIKRDIQYFQGNSGTTPFTVKESFEEIPVSQMRKAIARRLSESKFGSPHFYLTLEINMNKAIEARTSINEFSPVKISFNDIIIKATSYALRENLKVNSSWLTDKIRYNHHIHIGVAIAVDEGLVVPVLKFADTLTLSQISSAVKGFAEKAKTKKIQPQDMEGNTFTISNLGMFGIDEFTAIINPPDACIMAIGGIKQVPVVKDGQIVPGNTMKVTLSSDHRVVDGATGTAFLQTFKDLLENPYKLLARGAV